MEVIYNNTFQAQANPKVECELYINNGESKFNYEYAAAEKKYPGTIPKLNISVYKNFNKNEMYARALGYGDVEKYIIKDSLNIINWKLQDSVKIVNGREVKFATTHWRDHDWEVWYDEKISVSEGPDKLHGLPGLIVEAKAKSCAGSTYYFTMSSISYSKDSFTDKIFFPFKNKAFVFIEYNEMYRKASKYELDNLKNNYLRSVESNEANGTVAGSSCVSSNSFDFCFCYPK